MNPTETAELRQKLLDTSKVGLSEAGERRIDNIISIARAYEAINRQVIVDHGGLVGLVTLLVKDGIEGGGEAVMHLVDCDNSKDLIAAYLHDRTDRDSYDALLTVAEVWVAYADECESVNVRPSQHPRRREAVMTLVHLNIGFAPCIISIIQPIIRIGKATCLGESQIAVMDPSEMHSRMNGIEGRLCPIT